MHTTIAQYSALCFDRSTPASNAICSKYIAFDLPKVTHYGGEHRAFLIRTLVFAKKNFHIACLSHSVPQISVPWSLLGAWQPLNLKKNVCFDCAVTQIQVKIWFQNRRAKWKRVKAGYVINSGGRSDGSGSSAQVGQVATGGNGITKLHAAGRATDGDDDVDTRQKIIVPIPVHVNRIALRCNGGGGNSNHSNHRQQQELFDTWELHGDETCVSRVGDGINNGFDLERRTMASTSSPSPFAVYRNLINYGHQHHPRLDVPGCTSQWPQTHRWRYKYRPIDLVMSMRLAYLAFQRDDEMNFHLIDFYVFAKLVFIA